MKRALQIFVIAGALAAVLGACGKEGTTVTVINVDHSRLGPIQFGPCDAGSATYPVGDPATQTRIDVILDAGASETVHVPGPGCYFFSAAFDNEGNFAKIFLEQDQDLDWAP